MPEYLPPGVFIQESNPGDQPIDGAATSPVGFFGIAERGPTLPTRIRHAGTGTEKLIPPGGHIAGLYARTDGERGVHRAPLMKHFAVC